MSSPVITADARAARQPGAARLLQHRLAAPERVHPAGVGDHADAALTTAGKISPISGTKSRA
jgi:hypothetical protein